MTKRLEIIGDTNKNMQLVARKFFRKQIYLSVHCLGTNFDHISKPKSCHRKSLFISVSIFSSQFRTCFGSTYTKIGTIQRRLAWPLRKDDTQNREAFHIFWPRW